VAFSYENASLRKFMPWKGAVRVVGAAPQTAGLSFYLAANILERDWVHAAFDEVAKRDLTPMQKERLNWLRPNFFTIGDYLKSNGIGWSYETKWRSELLDRMPTRDLSPENLLMGRFGRWDTTIILDPSVEVPENLWGTRSSTGKRLGEAA